MSWFCAEYWCRRHGAFDELHPRSAVPASSPCPSCHRAAERVISAPKPATTWGAVVSRGKTEPHDNPWVLNTKSLGEGERYSDWKKRRREFKAEMRRREVKKELG